MTLRFGDFASACADAFPLLTKEGVRGRSRKQPPCSPPFARGDGDALRVGITLAITVALVACIATTAAATPALDYMLHCRGCHGPEGAGVPPDVPDLRGKISRLVQRPGGREFVLRVPGVAQSELDDERTARLLNWLVEAFGEPKAAASIPSFTAAEVGRWRRQPLVDIENARPR